MNSFREIKPAELDGNTFDMIGSRWLMLGCKDSANARTNIMTASWGELGVLWGKPVCTVFVRKSRYTHDLLDCCDRLGVSVFPEKYRAQLALCGRESGRNVDKVSACGFTPIELDGAVGYEEADIVLCLKKLYADEITADKFIDSSLYGRWYQDDDIHTMYICEIEKVLIKEQ